MKEKTLLSISDVVERTGLQVPTIYAAKNCGDLEVLKIGRRTYVTPAAEAKWLAKLEKASKAGKPITYRGGAR